MMPRRLLRLALLVAVPAASLAAQTPRVPATQDVRWTRVRVTKWALLGVAGGLATYALHNTSSAQRSYDRLTSICLGEPDRCTLRNGRYPDAELEALYASTGRADRRARVGIASAQLALFGSVGLFIYDLRNERGPRNIPYPTGAASAAPSLGVGLRFAVRAP